MDFIIKSNLNGDVIIELNNNKYSNSEIKIEISDFNKNIIRNDITKLNGSVFYWYKHNVDFNVEGIQVLIYQYDNIICNRKFRFKNKYGASIKPQGVYINNIGGLGDQFSAEPLIRKLSNIFEQNIAVFTKFPQLFINNPYISQIFEVNEYPKKYENEYEIHNIFDFYSHSNGYQQKWASFDWKQKAANELGFMLTPNEMELKFYPNEFENIEKLPDDYVLINPSITGADRNWSKDNWQSLIDLLNHNNINVVSIGKNISYNNKNLNYFDLNIKKGLNLSGDIRQDSLSQTWHLINKSKIFVTMDNGLFILAGSTDTHILQLGSPIDPYYHKPYRNGTQDYKYSYVVGGCNLHCFSDLKFSILELGQIKESSIKECQINKPYMCHPSPENVANKIFNILKKGNYILV